LLGVEHRKIKTQQLAAGCFHCHDEPARHCLCRQRGGRCRCLEVIRNFTRLSLSWNTS